MNINRLDILFNKKICLLSLIKGLEIDLISGYRIVVIRFIRGEEVAGSSPAIQTNKRGGDYPLLLLISPSLMVITQR